MTIVISSGDGYLGWPTSLRIASRTNHRVGLVDNFDRREWVESVGSRSADPIASIDGRLEAGEEDHGLGKLSFVDGDIGDRSVIDQLPSVHEPEAVVHTAAQPSTSYP